MSLAASAGGAARTAAGRLTGLSRAISRATTHSSFPPVDGMLGVRGADGLIEVIRDRHGVPHIFASTAADAGFGHGFVHAQDRLFQMEGARRLASGRLSEVLGRSGLASDRLLRRVGLARAARRDAAAVAAAGGRAHALLEAYARGVNEGVRHLPALPPELALLGDRFEPWTVADIMLISRYVMFGFAGNWNTELVRERLAEALGADLASAVDPVHPPVSTVTGERYPRSAARLLEAYEAAVMAGMPAGGASNAWAVTSALSSTGAPLLASDPHVDVALPGVFHVAHLSGGGLEIAGAGVPGVPGVMIGHNQRVAWGLTAGMADVSDCYVEEFDPREPTRYRTPDGWATAEVRAERFDVLGEPAVTEQVLVTRHGPVVSPALSGERRAIALRSTVVEGSDVASSFVALWHATGIDEARRAIERWPGTTFNFIMADRDDRVAYQFVGQVPQREPGEGLFPQIGATSPGPRPPWPSERLPRVIDPPRGFVVSANNAPGGDLELGEEWSEPARAERIRAMIEARTEAGRRHDVASFTHIQTDMYSSHLVRLRDLLLARRLVDDFIEPVLRGWDGQLGADSAAGALVSMTYRLLITDCAERLAGSLGPVLLGQAVQGVPVNSAFAYRAQGAVVAAAESAASPWFEGTLDRDRRVRGAASRAASLLTARSSADPARWRLGDVQRWPAHHAFDGVPGLGRLFSRGDRPFGGDVNTLVQGQSTLWTETPIVRIAPGYRQVVDLDDWDRSVFMLPTGNNGIPGHPRYDDCIDEYVTGAYRPLLFSREAVEPAAEAWLVLEREETR